MSEDYRVFNFSAGPSILPIEVLNKVKGDLTNFDNTGESVMEMSHRSKEFMKIAAEAESDLRDLMNIPEDYYVLFLQGGGTLQFSMVPINLLSGSKKADYVLTGEWSKKAAKEAQKFGDIKVVASSESEGFNYIPKITENDIRPDADYVYVCYNNTIYGSHFNEVPDVGDHVLVADMSSCILSEEIDVSKFGLIFAGAQKNIAPAGLTIVIVRKDLVGKAPSNTPVYLDYKIHADKDSMYNTPPCWSIYIAGQVFKHIKNLGGVSEMHRRNLAKAEKLYAAIDKSKLFRGVIVSEDRSLMTVTFVTGDPDLDKKFVAGAREKGMINLGGHRSVGGLRAGIFNAMPPEGVDALVDYMESFEKENRI